MSEPEGCETSPTAVAAAPATAAEVSTGSSYGPCDVLALCELWRELDFPDDDETAATMRERLEGTA